MPTPNPIFSLVARGASPPASWGFPLLSLRPRSEHPEALLLRSALLPLADEEGLAQLLRWHFALIRSRPHVWRSLAGSGPDAYEPADVYKPPLSSTEVRFAADPEGGFLTLDWAWAGETPALSARARVAGASSLELQFGDEIFMLSARREADQPLQRVVWPDFMKCRAAVVLDGFAWIPGTRFNIAFRIPRFDARALLARITPEGEQALNSVGMLDVYLAAVNPLDKLASVWLAIALLEHRS